MTTRSQALKRLVRVVRVIKDRYLDSLDKWKLKRRDLKRPDFLWHYMLQNFATSGNSRGWSGLINTPKNYNALSFRRLQFLSLVRRAKALETILRRAKVRLPASKARWLARNVSRISALGGLSKANQALMRQPGRDGKIRFLKAFDGVGDKIARNIMMDVFHPDFEEAIAVDVRIKGVSRLLGIAFKSYADHEAFYLEAARRLGLSGWELDRLLFTYNAEVVCGLQWLALVQGR